jgi:hypothetical protein
MSLIAPSVMNTLAQTKGPLTERAFFILIPGSLSRQQETLLR